MTVEIHGGRELAARFDTMTTRAHDKIVERMQGIVDRLQEASRAAAPFKTGKLREEITGKVYSDSKTRIAGYVSVFAPDGGPEEYPKAATLEYGTQKARKTRVDFFSEKLGRMSKRRIVARATKSVTIAAFRYLRGPFETMQPMIEAEIAAALQEAAEEDA